jgi:hypothetical protein
MGRRAGRRLTRELKIQHPGIAVKSEIGRAIEAGEPLSHIADRIRKRIPIGKDKALKMVTTEFDAVAKDWMTL